jgi:hypothetical protein
MANLLGQASGGFTESSSALRIMYAGVRNTIGVLSDDAFTQTNPPIVTVAATISAQVDTTSFGVLSGSVCFARRDQGGNIVGGPVEPGVDDSDQFIVPLGVFINSANGNAYENTPGTASGKGPYMSSQGTYGCGLFETQALAATGAVAQGDALVYLAGMDLVASRNGFIQPRGVIVAGNLVTLDIATITAEVANGRTASTLIGVLKCPADAELSEIIFDQRV